MSLIPYWNATGNTTYNDIIIERMHNQSEGIYSGIWEEIDVLTSDFVSWGLAAVAAAEVDFPGSPTNSSWLAWAKKVAYTLDLTINQGSVCNGGLYDDESDEHGTQFDWFDNGAYFQLASRIASASSGSDQGTYAEYAASAWSWSEKNGMVNTTAWTVSEMVSNTTANASTCAAVDTSRWTWAYGLYLSGAAHMYHAVGFLLRYYLSVREKWLMKADQVRCVDDQNRGAAKQHPGHILRQRHHGRSGL